MKFDPQIHHRRSIRLKAYDYSQPGAYFVTIVAHERIKLFGEIKDGVLEIVRVLKSFSARRINKMKDTTGLTVWQRSNYEHIIQNQRELNAIREYIVDNSRRWPEDEEYQE